MFWFSFVVALAAVMVGWVALPAVLAILGVRFVKRRLLGDGGHRSPALLPPSSRKGCPAKEREVLRQMEKRLVTTHQQCLEAMNVKLTSELARARIAPVLEEAYEQINDEIESIYAFCERNDLVGTLKKANGSPTARDIYLEAYQRDLAKVQTAIEKTEECLSAYERTVATLEVSSTEADIDSDFDVSIGMLRNLRDELPRYNLEDRI